MTEPRIAIIGAGPTGLGAAWRLTELGHLNLVVFDSADRAGGLASSVTDEKGFTWDLGGHVLFSHYKYFDRLMDQALGDQWIEHEREAWVWMREQWIPYPLQNNIWRLPSDDLIPSLEGLLAIHNQQQPQERPGSFHDWLLRSFGQGLCDTFMFPYNRKVWAYSPADLDVGWMGERVATVDLARILRNLVLRRDDVGWGPNATFRFPLKGGTGAIWRSVHGQLPQQRFKLRRRIVGVNTTTRNLRLSDGTTQSYDYLLSTMPLDILIRSLEDRHDLRPYADRFVHSSSHIIGVGFGGETPKNLLRKCWMYFPEADVPFYRVTVFSNYSPNNVPRPGGQWSLMAEVSESPQQRVNGETIVREVISGFRRCHLIPNESSVVSTWHRRLEHGYPTPWLGRDDVLNLIDLELSRVNVLSRGRFGAWRYEVANQDHSVMQGVEAADHILLGVEERTYRNLPSSDPSPARCEVRSRKRLLSTAG